MAPTDEVAPVAEDPKKESGDTAFDGVVKGKYSWSGDVQNKNAEFDGGADITKYSWSDGKKTVSVYVELDGLDDVPDDQITAVSGEKDATLTVAGVGSPPKKRVLKLNGLNAEITAVKATKKKGKNMVSLKLTKKEEEAWPKLIATSGGGGGDAGEDEEGPGGGMGGMMGGMGGMMGGGGGGMMGGMGGMMGGMGDMGGDAGGMGGMGGMDMNAMMAAMGGGGGGMGDMPDGGDLGKEGDDNNEEVD